MDGDLGEIREFLRSHRPFSELSGEALDLLATRINVAFYPAGTQVIALGDSPAAAYLLCSGSLDIRDTHGSLLERCRPGIVVGHSAIIESLPSRFEVRAAEDTLVYVISAFDFNALVTQQPGFAVYLLHAQTARLRQVIDPLGLPERGDAVLTVHLHDLIRRVPVTASPELAITDAAALMRAEQVSGLVVREEGRLVGIVTDRDLRDRVVAEQLDPSLPLRAIMSGDPVSAAPDSTAFEALMQMVGNNVHHVPVVDDDDVVGVVSSTDLIKLGHALPMALAGDVAAATRPRDLVDVPQRLIVTADRFLSHGAKAADIGRVITSVSDAVDRRFLHVAADELGPAPVPYCWVALGSQARLELGLASDQDHALILGEPVGGDDAHYYAALAEKVRESLMVAGRPPCAGDVMATNPRWRMDVETWKRTFSGWIHTPTPEAVLEAGIFFDMRPVAGDVRLFDAVRRPVLDSGRNANRFLGYMAKHAVAHQPPLGSFRAFSLEKRGPHKNTVNLKDRGVNAVVQLVRVLTLAEGLPQVDTRGRLSALAERGALASGVAADLRSAFELMSYVRLRHQLLAGTEGRPIDSYVGPGEMTPLERSHLRDAFQVVKSAQALLSQRYPLAFIS